MNTKHSAALMAWGDEERLIIVREFDDGLRFRYPAESCFNWLVPIDAQLSYLELRLNRVSHELAYTKCQCGQPCLRCGIGRICGTFANAGKYTVSCTFCGRWTVGHDRERERGPRPVPMPRVTRRHHLNHIYGGSYFGSGGGYGRVKCLANCRTVGTRDNGFMSGPDAVEVVNIRQPAEFVASGGDCIGSSGRSWSDGGIWNPQTRRWE